MEYPEIKEWLDKLVDNNQQRNELVTFSNQIRTLHPDEYIFIFTGIELIAEAMGIKLTESVDKNRKFIYTYSFYYRGMRFIQFGNERLVTADVQV